MFGLCCLCLCAALDNYMKASEKYPGDTSLILGVARVYDALNDLNRGVQFYKKVRG